MDNEPNHDKKMLELKNKLLAVEEERLAGKNGYSVEELESYLDKILEEEKHYPENDV